MTSKHVQHHSEKTYCRVIAICNQKGGCGKTTTVINLGAALASLGAKVLVVDLDSQANATSGLGIELKSEDKTVFHLLTDIKNLDLDDIVLDTAYAGLKIAPSNVMLSEFESRVANELGRENRLRKALQGYTEQYDYILIDTPPSLGLLLVNALNAAHEIFISMQAHPFALDGLNLLVSTVELVCEELNPSLQISGVVTTMFDHRTKISKEILDKLKKMTVLENKIFNTVIRQNVKLTEATKCRKPIMYYDPNCTGAHDYLSLAREVESQNNKKSQQNVLSRHNKKTTAAREIML